MQKPIAEEYPIYFKRYIKLISKEDPLVLLEEQKEEIIILFGNIDESKTEQSYAPGKWTIKEVLGYMIDSEREVYFLLNKN